MAFSDVTFAAFSVAAADAFLASINIFNVFVWFYHIHPVESPLKKPFASALLQFLSRVHSTPFVVSSVLATLLSITTCSTITYAIHDTSMLIRAIVSAYTFAFTSIFVKHTNIALKLSIERILEIEKEAARHDIVNFEAPSPAVMEAVAAPLKPFLNVESTGIERIPDGTPHLFVSNHSLYGIEMPLFINLLQTKRGIFPRGLADHIHFATPNGPILRSLGAVDGTKENVDALMQAKHDVLVYPGGGHEVLKGKSVPRYELMWKERVGFARCAIKHGYPIVPCACVGTEDMFESLFDIPTPYRGYVIPVAVPRRVQKVYFWFGEPISTTQYNGEFRNDQYAREVRDSTKAAIEAGIRELKEMQGSDPERYLVDWCTTRVHRSFSSFFSTSSSAPATGEAVHNSGIVEEENRREGKLKSK